jgi:hypothetical protein
VLLLLHHLLRFRRINVYTIELSLQLKHEGFVVERILGICFENCRTGVGKKSCMLLQNVLNIRKNTSLVNIIGNLPVLRIAYPPKFL